MAIPKKIPPGSKNARRESEFRAYPWIVARLKAKGWNTANPNRNHKGQVWTQNECLAHSELSKSLGKQRPENVVKLASDQFWIIEAKPGLDGIESACEEARQYANLVNENSSSHALLATGVAGSETDGFIAKSFIRLNGKWKEIYVGKKPLTNFLTRTEADRLIALKTHNLQRDPITIGELVNLAKYINETLHIAKVDKESRAMLVAILLLAIHSDPTLSSKDPDVFLRDINTRAEKVFRDAGKLDLWEIVKIQFLKGSTTALAEALAKIIQSLKDADLLDAAVSADVLGPFFESFLKYGNTSKDLGIVLTPRHLCWLAAEALDVRQDDIIYDPAAGTGGFLIAAFNRVKNLVDVKKAEKFAKTNLFGAEFSPKVAALAFINMYFRGDGKHNLSIASCFDYHLAGNKAANGPRAKFSEGLRKEGKRSQRAITKVLMNPPFALKDSKEKEPDFIDHALDQMVEGGQLFSVLPASVFYERKYSKWRTRLLEQHTLLAVVSFPNDVFYPVATESIGVFIKCGISHPEKNNVLWARIEDDGFVKRKKFRVEAPGLHYEKKLQTLVSCLQDWIGGGKKAHVSAGEREFHPISSTELIPHAHLGTPKLSDKDFEMAVNKTLKGMANQLWDQDEKLGKAKK